MPRDDPKTPPMTPQQLIHSQCPRGWDRPKGPTTSSQRRDLPTMHRGLERPPPTMHRGGPPCPSMPREGESKEEPRPGCRPQGHQGRPPASAERGGEPSLPSCSAAVAPVSRQPPRAPSSQGWLTHHRRWQQAVNAAAAAARPGTTAPAPPVRDWADVWLPRGACAAVWTVPVVLSEEGLSGASSCRSPRKGVWASPLAYRVYLVRSATGFARA